MILWHGDGDTDGLQPFPKKKVAHALLQATLLGLDSRVENTICDRFNCGLGDQPVT